MADGRKTMTINEVAEECKVSRRTVYNWLRNNKLETKVTPGGSLRIYVDSIWRDKKA